MFLNFDTVEAFAVKRNPSLSFPFLKENGELLSIALNAGLLVEPRALELYRDIYNNAFKVVDCYPQYYRFILGMILDLESCGMDGNQGRKIADYVKAQKLLEYDTSDVRRLETLHLLSTHSDISDDYSKMYKSLIERVDIFIQNPKHFCKFNKPLFYDLTHIIFFLTDYGRKASPLTQDPIACLMNMGLLALLDNDADLLSEVGLCLDYLKYDIPPYWDDFLTQSMSGIGISYDGTIASALNPSVDEYHLYLVSNAYMATRHNSAFHDSFSSRTPSFFIKEATVSLLSKLSEQAHIALFQNGSDNKTLRAFTETLSRSELNHWENSLASHPNGLAVAELFSGFSAPNDARAYSSDSSRSKPTISSSV